MKIKYNIVKFVYSCIGFYRTLFFFKEGHKYYGGAQPNTASIYRGNRTFYESTSSIEPTCGVCFFSTINKTYPYWQLGIFKWSENNNNIEVLKSNG